jgi:hypothetical protein
MFFPGKVLQFRITPDNLKQFFIRDGRTKQPDYIIDRKAIEQKMIRYEKGEVDELTKRYLGRYDLTVLTYTQYEDPYTINDGCHRITALRTTLFPKKLIDGFTFWLIPSNIAGAETKEEAYRLNEMVNEELKKNGLPLWVKKFEFCEINGKLTAWKNINIIDTGDINQPLQFGVDWKLNEGINFAENKDIKDLPKWADLIKVGRSEPLKKQGVINSLKNLWKNQ